MTWIEKWEVDGSNGKTWTVALSDTGEWGCSCPVWKFRRVECHHIQQIKDEYNRYDDVDYTDLEKNLLTIIRKSLVGLTSKSKSLNIKINNDFVIGINNIGIGRVEADKTNSSDDKQVYRINDLETYLTIFRNKKAINKIKKLISKDEKKKLLDMIYKCVNDLDTLEKEYEQSKEDKVAELLKGSMPYLLVDVI